MYGVIALGKVASLQNNPSGGAAFAGWICAARDVQDGLPEGPGAAAGAAHAGRRPHGAPLSGSLRSARAAGAKRSLRSGGFLV